jgi:hypothetical protein
LPPKNDDPEHAERLVPVMHYVYFLEVIEKPFSSLLRVVHLTFRAWPTSSNGTRARVSETTDDQ